MRPAAGRIRLLGTDVWAASPGELNALRRRFGMLFQDGALFSSLTVAENIAVPFRENTDLPMELIAPLCGSSSRWSACRPTRGKDAGRAFRRHAQAGGARLRARARAGDPISRRADFGARPGARAFDSLVRLLSDSLGLTVFIVTHDLDTLLIIDRTIVLSKGCVIADGPVSAVMRSPDPWIREYFSARARGLRRPPARRPDGTGSEIHSGRHRGPRPGSPWWRPPCSGCAPPARAATSELKIYFERQSLEGLQPRSEVRMRGIRVGSVTGFRISSWRPGAVEVMVRVDGAAPVRQSTRAVVERHLVTGIASILLVNLNEESPPLTQAPQGGVSGDRRRGVPARAGFAVAAGARAARDRDHAARQHDAFARKPARVHSAPREPEPPRAQRRARHRGTGSHRRVGGRGRRRSARPDPHFGEDAAGSLRATTSSARRLPSRHEKPPPPCGRSAPMLRASRSAWMRFSRAAMWSFALPRRSCAPRPTPSAWSRAGSTIRAACWGPPEGGLGPGEAR